MSSSQKERLLVAMDPRGCRDLEGDAVLAKAMAERLFAKQILSERLRELRETFTEAMQSYDDALGVQAVNRWVVEYVGCMGGADQHPFLFTALREMFWEAHAKYRGGAYPMDKTLLAVFGNILAMWRPQMSETSIAAFEFCAAGACPMSGREYEGWTGAMRLFREKMIHNEDRAAMVGMIRDRANKKDGFGEKFDAERLGAWTYRYADTVHFSGEILTDLMVARARRADACDEAMRAQVCEHLLVVDASRALRAFLGETVVRQWAKFDKRVMNVLVGIWPRGHENEMELDGIGRWNNFYGTILIAYHARFRVQVDVVLPEEISTDLSSDMGRRAEEWAKRFSESNANASILIGVFTSTGKPLFSVHIGESFDDCDLEALRKKKE